MPFGWTAAGDGTRCASCLPSNLRSRPGRGLSLMALKSFLDEPLPHSGNSGVDQKRTGYLTVPKSFICLSSASARLTVRTDGLPRRESGSVRILPA